MCRQRLVVLDLHSVGHAQPLFVVFRFRLADFLGKDLAIESELASKDDILLDEETLLPAAKRAAADLLPRVAGRGIGPQA